jgi:hypothetical protein
VLPTVVVIGASSIRLEDLAGVLHCLRFLGVAMFGRLPASLTRLDEDKGAALLARGWNGTNRDARRIWS